MNPKISITALSSISPLGSNADDIWSAYIDGRHRFTTFDFPAGQAWVAALPEDAKGMVANLRASDSQFRALDDSVLYAILASRQAVAAAGWKAGTSFGINIGSSRGATALFEKHHESFLESGRAHTLASPVTTLGNISSWVAHDLQSAGPEISHSITCSTALHALLNGIAWIGSGMADQFLVGGSEAPLTAFTIAQMRAMKIYSNESGDYPCKALDPDKKRNAMILGEGAAVCCLERGYTADALAHIIGIGYATEVLEHSTSISAEADCFNKSMRMALGDLKPADVDVIVMHAPGTVKGDHAESRAVFNVFGADTPLLTTNKWQLGHTFGPSGMFSIEMAVMMMTHNRFIPVPFLKDAKDARPAEIRTVMVNAVGFGGNAVSILLRKP